MARLSDTQSMLLTTASTRPDLSVLPAPDSIKVRGAALTRTLDALLRRGLIEEGPAGSRLKPGISAHDRNGTEGHRDLRISRAGLEAIGVEDPAEEDRGARTEADPADMSGAVTRPGGKLGLLLETVSHPGGATLDELAAKAGWLPHTTRAALTRLRQRGYDIRRTSDGDRRSYRLDVPA